MYFILLFSFLFGVIIGSFLNVVAYRFNTGKTLGGRSKCFFCGKTLSPLELIPIVSFLVQKGKCKKCKSAISVQYPLVELATGILFALGVANFLPLAETDTITFIVSSLLYFIIVSILMVVFVYDLRHKIIPDNLSIAFGVMSFLYLLFIKQMALVTTMAGWASLLMGPFIAFAFFLIWYISKGTWIGLGDAKLVIGFGWFLGAVGAISAIVVSFWVGALFSLVLLALSKVEKKGTWLSKVNLKTEIPFAPFLIIGLFLVFFFHWDVLHLRELMSFY